MVHVREIVQGPVLGDFFERYSHQRNVVLAVGLVACVVFALVALVVPMVGLLLLTIGILAGAAAFMYTPKKVHGLGRNAHHRGQRR